MVTRLILQNFTTFENLDLDLSSGVNVIIGKNGTGKTHIIKAIYSMLITDQKEIDSMHKILSNFLPNSRTRLIQRVPNVKAKSAKIIVYYPPNERMEIEILNQDPHMWSGSVGLEYDGEVVYIPVKEMLANAPGFRSLYSERHIHFEGVYDDILAKAYLPELRKLSLSLEKIVVDIEKTIGGKIVLKNEEFFLETPDGDQIEFTLVAEGMRKLALLLLLIKNGCIGKGSLLLWDEPETNMNPLLISLVVEILLKLEQEGVQIILTTHSYVLLKELDLRRKKENKLLFHALFEKDGQINSESAKQMLDIKSNAIHEEFDSIYDREVERALSG